MIGHSFLEKLVCPISGERLVLRDDGLVTQDGLHRYPIERGIPRLFVTETTMVDPENTNRESEITTTVQDFYEATPFPNYNDFETISDFVRKARQGIFAKLLSEQIPTNANVLEVGCGTAQLSNYLAATTMSRIWATDMTINSLHIGQQFAESNNIRGICFVQMNLFYPAIVPKSMDIVISIGVLHHTHDTKAAFKNISHLVKPGGYIIVGLYNRLGRLRTDFRQILYKALGEKALLLDPHLRKDLSPAKRSAWIRDQYLHPQERKHTISEVLRWFDETGFDFINSIPKIVGEFATDERLFARNDRGASTDRILAELGMLFTRHGGEGGLYIMLGRKR
jgi:2-polyprenyl-3-methyl-5-hydroxy-6-metoxy-1,4-benzoquinol methylase